MLCQANSVQAEASSNRGHSVQPATTVLVAVQTSSHALHRRAAFALPGRQQPQVYRVTLANTVLVVSLCQRLVHRLHARPQGCGPFGFIQYHQVRA